MGDSEVKIGILDKLKLLMWLNSLFSGGSKMDKLKGLLGKLDGAKSLTGLLMVTAYYALPQFGIHVPDVVLKIGSGLAGVGLAAKLEKGTEIITKGLVIARKVIDGLQAFVDAVAPKKEAPKA